jgi:large subunit ribosomal protein L13
VSNNKSYYPKASDVQEQWFLVDAKGETVGRLAARIALILRGKNEPTFHPAVNPRNYVVVVNAAKAVFTGNKMRTKQYHWHTQYPGGLRSTTPEKLNVKKPGEHLRQAIHGMLPKNRLGDALKRNLLVYGGAEHPHEAQSPVAIEITKQRNTSAQGAN